MINEEEKNSASWRWEQKVIINSRTIYDCDIDRKAIFNGNGEIHYSQEFVKKDWGTTSLMLEASTDIQDVRPRPSCSFSVAFDHENWSSFNRLSVWVYPKAQGFVNFYFHASITNQANQSVVHAPSLIPNEWNHVFFEFTDFSREDVVKISMGPLLMGCPPEAEPIASFFFSNIVLEEVKPDYDFGWNLEDRIAYCHSGYFLTAEKKAIVEMKNPILFEIINESKAVVLTKLSTTIENEYGLFQELDFTNITSSGYYQIKMANQTTPFFEISSFPYRNAVLKSVEFLKSLRCGCEVQGVHGPCHITHHTIHPLDQRLVSDNGGWHDAGDVSQFEICTAEIVHSLIDCYEKIKSIDEDLAIRLLDEAKWGAHWLLKTHFGDGYRALAVLYSVWTSNQIKSADLLKLETPTTIKNIAENGPFENFLASAALSACAKSFQKKDDIFANYCLRIAKADYYFGIEGFKKGLFTRRWGKGPVAQVSGSLVLAASQLYELTNDDQYLNDAVYYAKEVISCQQKELSNWKMPLRGFFYEDPNHTYYLTYEHRGHEQSPITGIVKLMNVAKSHPEYNNWKEALELYQEFIIKTKDMILPFRLLPASLYEKEKMNIDRLTLPNRDLIPNYIKQLHAQIEEGIKVDNQVFLRRFPIAIQRRGFHATLLSKTKAVSNISSVLKNETMKQVAIDQLEWVLGKNPFSSSTQYGEGHNYHPLYVAFSQQLIGALPVGIETKGIFDKPYWPVVNNAVYKEVWGHTTAKFLWVVADLL